MYVSDCENLFLLGLSESVSIQQKVEKACITATTWLSLGLGRTVCGWNMDKAICKVPDLLDEL